MMMKFFYVGTLNFGANEEEFRLSNVVMSYFVVGACTYGTYLIRLELFVKADIYALLSGAFQRNPKNESKTNAPSAPYGETNVALSADTTMKI